MTNIFPEKYDEFLECQLCGEPVRILSNHEAQQVSDNPYNYIVFCVDCRKDALSLIV